MVSLKNSFLFNSTKEKVMVIFSFQEKKQAHGNLCGSQKHVNQWDLFVVSGGPYLLGSHWKSHQRRERGRQANEGCPESVPSLYIVQTKAMIRILDTQLTPICQQINSQTTWWEQRSFQMILKSGRRSWGRGGNVAGELESFLFVMQIDVCPAKWREPHSQQAQYKPLIEDLP